jgi:uncharacterized protein
MRLSWMRSWLALVLLGAAPLASVAGFDCGKASNSVEHAICGDLVLSTQDGRVADAYAKARQRANDDEAEKLRRDERNWLVRRNWMLSQHFDQANIQGRWIGDIGSFYEKRIDFLNHLFQKSAHDVPLLTAIVSRLPASVKVNNQSRWKFVGGNGSVFEVASENKTNVADVNEEIPGNDAAGLSNVLKPPVNYLGLPDFDGSHVMLALLPSVKFGGLHYAGNSLHCVAWSLFSWDGHAIKSVEIPQLLQQNCGDVSGALASFQGRVYALQYPTFKLTHVEIAVQARVGGNWSAPHQLLVRYDHSLGIPKGYCDSTRKDCDALTKLAYGYARRYDRTQYPDALNGALFGQEKATFDAMLKVATANADHQFDGLSTFGAILKGHRDFADDSIWFPVRRHGEMMLGRIGHGGFAWHSGNDWYVGIWSWNGESLSPVAGVIVPVQRSNYLLSEII